MSLVPELPFTLAGRYFVAAELGRGGNAIVYRARDLTQQRDVAIKILRDDVVSPHSLARFHQEMKVSAALDHPNIMRVYDTGEHDGRPYIVLELVEGRSLAHRLEQERQFPVADALAIARDVGSALAFAHKAGVIHRDIKPENILLAERGAVLADFGIARVTQEGLPQHLTSTGITVGTVLYMSPEQLMGERQLDGRTDQYSLACVLYEMLAGVRPHIAATMEGLRTLRTMEKHLPISAHRRSVGTGVEVALSKALSSMTADRYPTMEEFVGAIMVPSTPARPPRNRVRFVAAGTAFLAATVAVGLWALPDRTEVSGSAPGIVSIAIADGATGTPDERAVLTAIRSELASWPDVRVVEKATARDTSAISLVAAVTSGVPLGVRVLVTSPGKPERTIVREVPAWDANMGTFARELSRDVIGGPEAKNAVGFAAIYVRSALALRQYVRGFVKLRDGHLDSSAAAFRDAGKSAPGFPQALFWAAQVGAWAAPRNVRLWARSADSAMASGAMHGADSLLGRALVAMSVKDYPLACATYREATVTAPESFVAWMGLGECQRIDSVVVPTPRGPRFRSSHWSAVAAYREAIDRAPTPQLLAALFDRIMTTTYALSNRSRVGYSAGQRAYFALPSLDADTIALSPIDLFESQRMGKRALPTTWFPAIRRGRTVALDLTAAWVAHAPESPDAWFQRALALELAGSLNIGTEDVSAIAALDRAGRSAVSPVLRAKIEIARVRIAIRQGDLSRAAQLARDAIETKANVDSRVRSLLAPLAALVGDFDAVARLRSTVREPNASVPAAVLDSVDTFSLRALLGECDGLARSAQSLDGMLRAQLTSGEYARQRNALLLPAMRGAVPCLGPTVLNGFNPLTPIDSAYAAIAANNSVAARQMLVRLRERREGATFGALTWDYLFEESWALMQAGDTITARARIAGALEDIGNMSFYTLEEIPQAAGLRRAIRLLSPEMAGSDTNSAAKKWGERGAALGNVQRRQ